MRRRIAAVVVVVVAIATVIACGDFRADPPGPDAGADASDAGLDTSSATDSAPDAIADAALTTYCSTQDASFCDDFDTPRTSPSAPWDGFDLLGAGEGVLEDGGQSPPLLFAARATGNSVLARLRKVLPAKPGSFTSVDGAIRVDTIESTSTPPQMFLVEMRPNTATPGIAIALELLVLSPGRLDLRLSSSYGTEAVDLTVTSKPVVGTWYRWHVEWTISAIGKVTMATHFDVQETNPKTVTFTTTIPLDFSQQTILIGPRGDGNPITTGVSIDDVTLRTE